MSELTVASYIRDKSIHIVFERFKIQVVELFSHCRAILSSKIIQYSVILICCSIKVLTLAFLFLLREDDHIFFIKRA